MAEEQKPAKKVVKRVVKKTVARPGADRDSAPQMRYGRQVTGTAARPKAKAAAPKATVAKTASRRPARPRFEISDKIRDAQNVITTRGASAASGVAGAVGSATRGAGSKIASRGRAVRDWRIPLWDPLPASIFAGAVAGLVAVGLGLAALAMFTHLRGVSSGGGRWGSLTFVVVAFVAFVVGELLLSAFGSTQARLTSFLGVVLTITAILGLFLGLADSGWGLLLVPVLGAITYAISHALLNIAEDTPSLSE